MALRIKPINIIESGEFPLLTKSRDWERVFISDIAKIQNGYAFSSSNFTKNEGLPLIRIRDISKSTTADYYSGEYFKEYLVKKGDILIGMDGDFNLVEWNGPEGLLNQRVCRVNLESQWINRRFFLYCLPAYLKAINEKTSSVTVKHLSSNTIGEIPLPLPPIKEQLRIAVRLDELFSSLDKGIESLKTAQEQIKIYRQAVLKWAFEGKLTNKDAKEGDLPERWKFLHLHEMVKPKNGLRRGPFGGAIKKECFVSEGFKVYEQGNAINDDANRGSYFITKEKYNELANFAVLPGDFLVSCSGSLGRITQITSNAKPGIINQALLRIRINSELIKDKYFIYYFRSAFFQKRLVDQSQGTAMANMVGIKDLKEITICTPPLEEQDGIIAEIESRLSVCDKLEESITQSLLQAEALRQSILKKAFEGKLVPQDPNDESASILLERIRAERAAGVAKNATTRTRGRPARKQS